MDNHTSVAAQQTEHAPRSTKSPPLALPLAIGTVLVVYGYLGGLWVTLRGATPEPLALLRTWVNIPFGVGEDFGALGIALLLITFGYQARETLRSDPLGSRLRTGRWPFLGSGVALAALLCAIFAAPHLPDWGNAVGRLLCAAALTLLGTIVHGRENVRSGHWPATPLGLGCLAAVLLVSDTYPGVAERWYSLTTVYALLIFLLALSRGHRIAATPVVRWLGSRGYSLSIATGVVGYPLLTLLTPRVSLLPAYLGALLATALCAEGVVRLSRTVARVVGGGAHGR